MRGIVVAVLKIIARQVRKGVNSLNTIPVVLDRGVSRILFCLNGCKNKEDLKRVPNPILFKRQFVAHGSYDLPYPNNSLQLFQAVIEHGFKIIECDVMFTSDNVPILCHDLYLTEVAKTDDGRKTNLKICKTLYSEIAKLDFSIDDKSHATVTKLDGLLSWAKKNNICIELDLNKKYLGRKKCKLLYDMVKKYGLLTNVIWEVFPDDFYSFLLLDNDLIFQLDNTWNNEFIKKYKRFQKYSSLIILSQWFPNQVNRDCWQIIREGHNNGFLMKCATLNRVEDTQMMFKQSVDLITTDSLTNVIIEKI